ncbi:RE1, partial [Symbiodinium microadriaticum]
RISLAEARQLEKDSRVMFAPAKCVFTLKPPQEAGKRTSTDALRLSLVIAALRCWLGAVSDITGAFLLASWPPDLPKYGIYPPRVVKDSGVTEAEAWLRRARIKVGEMTLVLRPTVAEPELWMILCEVTGSMHGLIVLYVDDIAYFSTEEIIKAIHEFIVQEWPASPLEWISADAPVRYLGVEIWREPRTSEGGEASWVYTIGQSAYVKDLLREHNMSEVHPTDLPAPREWIEEAESSEEVEGDYDESTLKLAQRHVGECLWLATKTRPDIMFVTTHAASLVSKRPSYVIRLSKRVLAYLAGSADLRMTMGSIDEDQKNNLELIAFTDASYAPYGKRSFGAAVITLAGSPVAWKSGRQSFITLSVMEAELYAATQGCTLLNSVEALAAELLPTGLVRVLAVDNTSAAAMLAGGPGSQRTRHLKIRANYVREAVEQGRLVVRHMPGSRQLADLSTKMQTKVRLQQLLGLWGFVGFSVNLLETVKLKLLAVLMIIAQCICPARGEEVVAKDPLPSTTWDEVAIMMVGVAIVAVCGWECLRSYGKCFGFYHEICNPTYGKTCFYPTDNDTLMLMRVEELKSALRLEGMLVSGLKNDLAERLLPRLVGTDVTNKQLKYVLFLWRAKALEYKCILRWEDINNKYRVSAWISRWKDT